MSISLLFLFSENSNGVLLVCSFYLFLIVATDTCLTEIPNPASFALLLAGFYLGASKAGFSGLLDPLLGMGFGLSLLFVPYLLGGMGAGDVKALAAMGALLGPSPIFQVFLYSALIGGAVSLLHFLLIPELRNNALAFISKLRAFAYIRDLSVFKSETPKTPQRFPYASTIALGYFSFLHWGGFF